MTDQQQNTNSNVSDLDLWKVLKSRSALEINIPDPEIARTIKKFYSPREGFTR